MGALNETSSKMKRERMKLQARRTNEGGRLKLKPNWENKSRVTRRHHWQKGVKKLRKYSLMTKPVDTTINLA